MTDRAEVARLLEALVEVAERATGHLLIMPEVAVWPVETNDEETFRRVVTGIYVWIKEQWPSHISFLRAAASRVGVGNAQLRVLTEIVSMLRTSHQHRLDPNSPHDARTAQGVARWFNVACGASMPRSGQDWLLCGSALYSQACAGSQDLLNTALGVEQEPEMASDWQRIFDRATEVDLIAIRSEIARDLGLYLSTGTLGFIDREIARRWRLLTSRMSANDDSDTTVRRIVMRELTAASTPELPCGLDEILDRLGIGAGRQAIGAVRLAQAVFEVVVFDGADEFLDRLADSWLAIQPRTGL
jgi:hypothetical protein